MLSHGKKQINNLKEAAKHHKDINSVVLCDFGTISEWLLILAKVNFEI